MKTLVNGQSGTIGKFISNSCIKLPGDLRTKEQLDNFKNLADNETVFIHLAGIVGNSLVEMDVLSSNRVNVEATIELGEVALKTGVKKFIYVSSSHVYGKSVGLINENFSTNPSSLYARQKLEAEKALLKIFAADPERLLIIRVFSILDFGMPSFTLGGAIENLIANPETAKLSNADDIRDFLTPKTVAKNLELIAESEISGIYNLCSSKGETIADAASKMASSMGIILPKTAFVQNGGGKTSIVGDNTKLKKSVPNLELIWTF